MTTRLAVCIALLTIAMPAVHAVELDKPNVETFIAKMVDEHDYDREVLRNILGEAEKKESILEAISKPAEKTLTWAEYRKIFLTKERINAGAKFWREHREALEDIEARSGVPIEMLVGIIGVETYYGRITGGHRVVDALATLAFYYPPRSRFFTSELEHFLLLIREEGMAATDAFGSYAGAMGRPQFMPSSYRAYAVDSTGDGKRDIWNNWKDVAGSVANYFNAHGWRAGKEVTSQATISDKWSGPFPKNILKAESTVGELSDKGVLFTTELPNDSAAQLLTLEGPKGDEHWVGFHNFFVITRYNRSVMYGLAVYQLGEEIRLIVRGDAP
jgi:membrane-bound lytic murein transglycosylase B